MGFTSGFGGLMLTNLIYTFGIGGAIIVVAMVITAFWIRQRAQGMCLAFVREDTNIVTQHLVSVESSLIELIGPSGRPETYVMKTAGAEKMPETFIGWPVSAPRFLRQVVPMRCYERDQPDPIPMEVNSEVTAVALTACINEAFLSVNKDIASVADAMFDQQNKRSPEWVPLVLSGGALLASAIAAFLVWKMSTNISEIKEIVGNMGGGLG